VREGCIGGGVHGEGVWGGCEVCGRGHGLFIDMAVSDLLDPPRAPTMIFN
jgi:hypothetical protein